MPTTASLGGSSADHDRPRLVPACCGPPTHVWRLDRGVLVGLLVSTEHLTVGTVTVPAGQTGLEETHDGEELVYVTRGELRVEAGGVEATLAPGDAFLVPAGMPHRYAAGDVVAEAIFGVAPSFGPADRLTESGSASRTLHSRTAEPEGFLPPTEASDGLRDTGGSRTSYKRS